MLHYASQREFSFLLSEIPHVQAGTISFIKELGGPATHDSYQVNENSEIKQ
jgi:hypothetical protein